MIVYESAETVVACAGMGCERVSRAVEATVARGQVGRLLSVGLAGACDHALHAGGVVRCGTVIDVRSGERFSADGGEAVLATSSGIASVDEKRRLFESYGAAAVDMEAACVARLARARGLGFGALKAISDDAAFAMDGLDRFTTAEGQIRELAFALHTAVRPSRWAGVMRLGRNSALALRALTEAVEQDLRIQSSQG